MNATRAHRFKANKKTRKRQQRQNFDRVLKKIGSPLEKKLRALDVTQLESHRSAKFTFRICGRVIAVR